MAGSFTRLRKLIARVVGQRRAWVLQAAARRQGGASADRRAKLGRRMAGKQRQRPAQIAEVGIGGANGGAHSLGMRRLKPARVGTGALPQVLVLDLDSVKPDLRERAQESLGGN